MFLMVFYDFKIRGGDLQGLSPRISFLYIHILPSLINNDCLT